MAHRASHNLTCSMTIRPSLHSMPYESRNSTFLFRRLRCSRYRNSLNAQLISSLPAAAVHGHVDMLRVRHVAVEQCLVHEEDATSRPLALLSFFKRLGFLPHFFMCRSSVDLQVFKVAASKIATPPTRFSLHMAVDHLLFFFLGTPCRITRRARRRAQTACTSDSTCVSRARTRADFPSVSSLCYSERTLCRILRLCRGSESALQAADVQVLVCAGHSISPVATTTGRLYPNRHLGTRPVGDLQHPWDLLLFWLLSCSYLFLLLYT